jgi:hypothetical protein
MIVNFNDITMLNRYALEAAERAVLAADKRLAWRI